MIALIDYGIGNLRSVEKALNNVGADVCLTSDPQVILQATKVVLPGVGAFGDGMRGLQARGLVETLLEVVQRATPLLGICLGMQLLFEGSDESPGVAGLGLLPGWVRRFEFSNNANHAEGAQLASETSLLERGEILRSAQINIKLKVPHTGWNQLLAVEAGGKTWRGKTSLLRGLPAGAYAYFNHGYYCQPREASDWQAVTEYGLRYASVVGRGQLVGVQFHPEKSQAVGLHILHNFVEAD